jgi:hypothetical protein
MLKKLFAIFSLCVVISFGSAMATTVVGTKVTDYLVKDKDETSSTKYYGLTFTVSKDWYGMQVSTGNVGYVVGKSTTSYNKWWINKSTYTYYSPTDVYTYTLN